MKTTSNASLKLYSSIFDQVAKFSITGLAASMVMTFLGGFEPAAYPWF